MSRTRKIFDPKHKDFDPNVDRYVDINDAVSQVMAEPATQQGDIERLEITLLANGEVTWRVWAAKAEEPDGGVFPPPS